MDRVRKFLKKLPVSAQEEIDSLLHKVEMGDTGNLDIKKLKGHKGLFRIRKGDIRIVFAQDNGSIRVLFIGKRGDLRYEQL